MAALQSEIDLPLEEILQRYAAQEGILQFMFITTLNSVQIVHFVSLSWVEKLYELNSDSCGIEWQLIRPTFNYALPRIIPIT